MQGMGGLARYGAMPVDLDGDSSPPMSATGWRDRATGARKTPWTVDKRFDVGSRRAPGRPRLLHDGAAVLGRMGEPSHSVQVRGGVTVLRPWRPVSEAEAAGGDRPISCANN